MLHAHDVQLCSPSVARASSVQNIRGFMIWQAFLSRLIVSVANFSQQTACTNLPQFAHWAPTCVFVSQVSAAHGCSCNIRASFCSEVSSMTHCFPNVSGPIAIAKAFLPTFNAKTFSPFLLFGANFNFFFGCFGCSLVLLTTPTNGPASKSSDHVAFHVAFGEDAAARSWRNKICMVPSVL